MARPRVFVSSTYYDLKHIRSSIEIFIEGLGYDAVLSEKGDIAYAYDVPLDESCYREVKNCEIYVLIIGGRYGSEASGRSTNRKEQTPRGFYERYESITKQEYRAAVDSDIPIYVLIESPVYSELHTFRRNKENNKVNYAHVDSVNVFNFIEEILAQPRNNPVQTFERYSDIEAWLKEQWAGMFREMLHRQSGQKQIASLASQVQELSDVNITLKRYLEEVMSKVVREDSAKLIQAEDERLDEAQKLRLIDKNEAIHWLGEMVGSRESAITLVRTAEEAKDVVDYVLSRINDKRNEIWFYAIIDRDYFWEDLNQARTMIGLPPLDGSPYTDKSAKRRRSQKSEDDSSDTK